MAQLRRVLLVGEDPLATMGLARVLEAADGWIVVEEIEDRPDAVLVDAGDGPLPDDVRALARSYPVLALLSEPERAREALSAGARGVVARSATGSRLARALDALAEGLLVLDEEWAEEVVRPTPEPLDVEEPLTARELEVLECLALGLSNKDIARRLGVSFHTVKFHVNSILGKLSASSRTEAVSLAARAGLLTF